MGFDNYYSNRKDRRKQYYDSRRYDRTCRNNGSCSHCVSKRTHKNNKKLYSADEQIKEHYFEGYEVEEFWYNYYKEK